MIALQSDSTPSALLTATWGNAQACARASNHVRECPICPSDFAAFLYPKPGVAICEEGRQILRVIAASEQDIKKAICEPMRRELTS